MSDDNAEKDEMCKHEGWTTIKDKKRHTTDILLTIMLIACWVAMTAIGLVVTGVIKDDNLSAGKPELLLNAMNYNGKICGVDAGLEELSNGYYMMDGSVVCVASCPSAFDKTAFICRDGTTPEDDRTGYAKVYAFECMYEMETTSVVNRCVPTGESASNAGVASTYAKTLPGMSEAPTIALPGAASDNWFSDMLADIYDNRAVVFGIGLGFSNIIAFFYLYILRIPGVLFVAIWGILGTIQTALLLGGFLLMTKATEWKDGGAHSDSEVQLMEIASYVVLVLAALYALLMLVMRKRVQLAIAVIKEAARALAAMPTLIFMPLIQSLGLMVFLVPWVVYCVYLASSGDMSIVEMSYTYPTPGTTTVRSFEYNDNTRYAFLYMLFSYFWTSQFIVAFGQMTIGLSIVAWYFTHDKSTVGSGTVFWAGKTVGRYHIGTVAYGSLVIAIIKTIRAILLYIQKKAHDSKNKVLQTVVACIGCCMWCVEKCMKFLNKNAYIQTAIYGTGFCSSAKKAFWMIARNIMRVMAVNMVGDFILGIGRLFIPTVTTLVAYLAIAYQSGSSNGLVLPLVFTWLLAYFIGCMYSEIFGMSIETILNCYVADEEMFPPELRFAEGSLRATMADTAKAAADSKVQPDADASNDNQSVVAKSAASAPAPAASQEATLL